MKYYHLFEVFLFFSDIKSIVKKGVREYNEGTTKQLNSEIKTYSERKVQNESWIYWIRNYGMPYEQESG